VRERERKRERERGPVLQDSSSGYEPSQARRFLGRLTRATGGVFLGLVEVVGGDPAGAHRLSPVAHGGFLVPAVVVVLWLRHGEPDVPGRACLRTGSEIEDAGEKRRSSRDPSNAREGRPVRSAFTRREGREVRDEGNGDFCLLEIIIYISSKTGLGTRGISLLSL